MKNKNNFSNRYITPFTKKYTQTDTLNYNNENNIPNIVDNKKPIPVEINPSNNILFEKLHYYINKLKNNAYQSNELYKLLSKTRYSRSAIDDLKQTLFDNFQESIEKTGIYITCRYREGTKSKDRGLIKLKRLLDQEKKSSEEVQICNSIITCQKKSTPRIPSMCDKILYSFTEDNICTEFLTFYTPYISDHKMIGFLCKISNENCIIPSSKKNNSTSPNNNKNNFYIYPPNRKNSVKNTSTSFNNNENNSYIYPPNRKHSVKSTSNPSNKKTNHSKKNNNNNNN
jgi:hypothetical protein